MEGGGPLLKDPDPDPGCNLEADPVSDPGYVYMY